MRALLARASRFDARCPGFDTFWALCDGVGASKGSKGFNGVATLVRRRPGVPTVTANTMPFGVPDLDDEGRCIVTDHGEFVLFNVYVPNAGHGSSRLPHKLRCVAVLFVLPLLLPPRTQFVRWSLLHRQRPGAKLICVCSSTCCLLNEA
jgi:hypothetical protein